MATTRSTGLGEPRATAQSTPMTMPIAMQATDIHSVLTRPRRMRGQVRNLRFVDQSMGQMAKARIGQKFWCRGTVGAAYDEGPDQERSERQDNDDRDDPAVVPRTDVTEP